MFFVLCVAHHIDPHMAKWSISHTRSFLLASEIVFQVAEKKRCGKPHTKTKRKFSEWQKNADPNERTEEGKKANELNDDVLAVES